MPVGFKLKSTSECLLLDEVLLEGITPLPEFLESFAYSGKSLFELILQCGFRLTIRGEALCKFLQFRKLWCDLVLTLEEIHHDFC